MRRHALARGRVPAVAAERSVKFRRQWFRPGRRIEQIGRFAEHPFFTRRRASVDDSTTGTSGRPRGALPGLAENAGALFSLIVSVVLIVVIVALVIAFVREIRRDTLQIEGFAVPKDLADRGYSSTVIAEQILDEIRKIQGSLHDATGTRRLESVSALPDFQVAAGGLSMKAVVRYARRLLDLPDNRIGGELMRDQTSLRIVLRIQDNARLQVKQAVREDGDIGRLLEEAGRIIAQVSDPLVLANYLYRQEFPSKRFDRTLAAIDYILTHPPASDDWQAYELLGLTRTAEGRTAEALKAYARALELRPDQQGIRGDMALALDAAGRRAEAIALLRESARLPGIGADQLVEIGSAMLYLGDFGEMHDVGRRALQADPKNATAYALIAYALVRKHRPQEALRAYEQGRTLARDFDFDARWGGIETTSLIALGRADEALRIAETRSVTQWENPWHSYSRALAAAALGRHAEAVNAYPKLLDEELPLDGIHVSWADSLLALGEIESAKAHYETAIELSPNLASAHLGLARVRVASGDPAGALPEFAKAARLDADDVRIRRERVAALDVLGRAQDAAADRAAAGEIEARLAKPLQFP